jgi:signal transduction histidine kinase
MTEAPTTSAVSEVNSSYQTAGPSTFPVSEHQVDVADRRILIVDDELPARKMFAEFLSDSYECSTAASAEEALAQLAVESYALVISDMMMPGRNGVELLREITARYPETAVIMISGVDRPQRVRDALRVGAFDYLIKPCEMDVLTLSVERALERRHLQRAARIYKAHLEWQNIELGNRKAELERLQAQLVHSEKMASLGQLAAGIAHELNNPAGFIYGNMDMLRDYLPEIEKILYQHGKVASSADDGMLVNSPEIQVNYEKFMADLKSIVSDCMEGAERIRDVVQNLRLFSRLDEAEIKQINVHEGIESTIRLLSRYYSSGRVKLRRDYGELPPISCYAGQLNQVWMNLLVNAAQAVAEEGEVTISTRQEGEWVIVMISDNGAGIAEDQLHKLFEPFFTTKPVGEGTGLGLSISYGIIQRHGGSIIVKSKLGSGTTFTVRIPIHASERQTSNPTRNELSIGDLPHELQTSDR